MLTAANKIGDAQNAARRILFRAAVLSLFANILMLTGPLYMLQVYDRVLSSRSYETLLVITILTLGLFAAMAIIELSRSAILARAGEEFESKLKDRTFDISMDVAGAGASNAELPLRDLRDIRQFVAGPALTALFDAPWSLVFLGVIFLLHWLLGIVALAGLAAILVLAIYNERLSRAAIQSAQRMALSAEKMTEAALRNANAADAMGMRDNLRRRWRNFADEANISALRATDRIGSIAAVTKATRLFLQSAVIGVGAYLAINGSVTPGVMIAASIIAGRALAPIEVVTTQWRTIAQAMSAYKRYMKVMRTAQPTSKSTPLPVFAGKVFVDHVYSRPASAKEAILKNVSFSIDAGDVIGVIGPSGAGKSALARVLVGVEKPISGEVRFDGARLDQWDRSTLGRFVGYLPQEIDLFAGTVAQNIARFEAEPASEDVIAAAQAAGVHELILRLEGGYETEIGDGGSRLSAGQRQRVGLARALYNDPTFIVLDEPNANLDGEGETALATALLRLKARHATVVLIAHRQSAVAQVDKILLLAGGEVRAFGPREEILRQLEAQNVTPISRSPRATGGGGS